MVWSQWITVHNIPELETMRARFPHVFGSWFTCVPLLRFELPARFLKVQNLIPFYFFVQTGQFQKKPKCRLPEMHSVSGPLANECNTNNTPVGQFRAFSDCGRDLWKIWLPCIKGVIWNMSRWSNAADHQLRSDSSLSASVCPHFWFEAAGLEPLTPPSGVKRK